MARLGRRLRQLVAQIPEGYDCVWDLCCDHGYLGLELLQQRPDQSVTLVDQLAPVMADLHNRLLDSTPNANWQCLTLDASLLRLPPGRHLLVVAGVGDEVLLRIMTALRQQHSHRCRIDWLLSPANNVFLVRHQLQQWRMQTQDQGLIDERSKLYEWLRVQEWDQGELTSVDNPAPFWCASQALHRQHLSRLAAHVDRLYRHRQEPLALLEWQAWQRILEQSPP